MTHLASQTLKKAKRFRFKQCISTCILCTNTLLCAWYVPGVVLLCGPPLSQGAQVCPLCQEVDCVEELAEHDCPPGHLLQEKVMFGCCPACVKYLDYAQPCPGPRIESNINLIYF